MGGAHVSGAEDYDLLGDGGEDAGLGAEGDGGGRARGGLEERLNQRGGGWRLEAGLLAQVLDGAGEAGIAMVELIREGLKLAGDEVGWKRRDGAPLDEEAALAGDDIFGGTAVDGAYVERGIRRSEEVVGVGLELVGEGLDGAEHVAGSEDGGGALFWVRAVGFDAVDEDFGEAIAFAGAGDLE